jgi:hypothetical protein
LLQEEGLSIQLHWGITEGILFAMLGNYCPLILFLTSFLKSLSIINCPACFWLPLLAAWLLIHDVDGKVPIATFSSACVSVLLVLGWRTSVWHGSILTSWVSAADWWVFRDVLVAGVCKAALRPGCSGELSSLVEASCRWSLIIWHLLERIHQLSLWTDHTLPILILVLLDAGELLHWRAVSQRSAASLFIYIRILLAFIPWLLGEVYAFLLLLRWATCLGLSYSCIKGVLSKSM